jgi:ethanolamine phosphate phosphodiesterase
MKEYKRFSRIFFEPWVKTGVFAPSTQVGRRQILSNLPGNHDLGFASGIQKPVKNRFNAYFGDGTRIDILGNHTFVSLDTVSLSAMDEDGSDSSIWKPSQEFLDQYPSLLSRKLSNYLHSVTNGHRASGYLHQVVEGESLASSELPAPPQEKLDLFPSILLTHVPLYRDQGTPCGPKREHWPPTLDSNGKPLEVDNRNSISVARGYQYQNVLSPEISRDITSKLVNLSYAFSGDDHDYCEVVHRQYPSAGGGIREITAKSISWAMGVRKPGVQLLSLWNPVDYDQSPNSPQSSSRDTLQTHLCLLPDQLGIFINYALLIVLTLISLICRSAYLAFGPSQSDLGPKSRPILPTSHTPPEAEKCESSSSDDSTGGPLARSRLLVKPTLDRARSTSPRTSTGYGLPAFSSESSMNQDPFSRIIKSSLRKSLGSEEGFTLWGTRSTEARRLTGMALFSQQLKWSTLKVAAFALPWYMWLIWTG